MTADKIVVPVALTREQYEQARGWAASDAPHGFLWWPGNAIIAAVRAHAASQHVQPEEPKEESCLYEAKLVSGKCEHWMKEDGSWRRLCVYEDPLGGWFDWPDAPPLLWIRKAVIRE
jgi:hypothetical protein